MIERNLNFLDSTFYLVKIFVSSLLTALRQGMLLFLVFIIESAETGNVIVSSLKVVFSF